MSKFLAITFLLIVIVNSAIQNLINTNVYYWCHDENYHIRYTVDFFKGIWDYHERITTPPGLYIQGLILLKFIKVGI